MKVKEINNIDEIVRLSKEDGGIILFGAGFIGQTVVRYMSTLNLDRGIWCVAATYRQGNPFAIENVPIIKLSALGHIKKWGRFVVTVKKELRDELVNTLIEFGCEDVSIITDQCIDYLLSYEVQQMVINCLEKKHLNNLYKRIEDLEWRIEEQNEICKINGETFEKYRNCYKGRDVVIVGSGTTLNRYRPIENAIHIGLNGVWRKENIEMDHYFLQDGRREGYWNDEVVDDAHMRNLTEGIDSNQIKCSIFMGKFSKRQPENYIEIPSEYDDFVNRYFVDSAYYGVERGQEIYKDITCHPLIDYGSVAFPALHFALFTAPRRIYLVGCDTTFSNYFDQNENHSRSKEWLRPILLGYSKMKVFAETYYPKTEIISINPIGLEGLFKDMFYTESQM